MKKEWDEFEDVKKDDGESRKNIIKKGLENLKIKESGIKGLVIAEDGSKQNV